MCLSQIGLQRKCLPGVFDGFVELAHIAIGRAKVHKWNWEIRLEFLGLS